MVWITSLLKAVRGGSLLTGRNLLILAVVAVLAWQQLQLAARGRQIDRLAQQNAQLLTELAQARGAIERLARAAADLRPGETRTITVDRPVPVTVPVPGRTEVVTVERQVPVIVTRTERAIETKVETLQLPGKEIERVIRESPQSIVAIMTALRDIRQGEQFSATFAQLQPGIWQPIVTPDSPIGIEAKVVTPIERIPQPTPVASRFTVTLYSGYAFGATPSWISGARADYRLSPRWGLEADAAHFWRTRTQEYRLLATFTF